MKKKFELTRAGCLFPCRKILIVMKVFALLFLLTITQVFAAGVYSQNARISINLSKTTVADVLTEIEKRSEFDFVYNNKLIDVKREVNIIAEQQDIYTILDLIFKDTDVKYVVDNQHIILSNQLKEEAAEVIQLNSIKGKVTSASGEALPGVTVAVRGTTTGTITNADGEYTLPSVPENSVLIFSFIGMKTIEKTVDGQSEINVVMTEEAIGLDEIVAVGYGVQKRKEVTGTVSSVQGSDLAKVPVTTAAEAITGKMAGVQVVTSNGAPDAEIKIRVRGGGSITQDNSPLYIIDGFPVENGLSLVSPADIERIDVLKDASSTAIYGARGANGVVIITTKGGKSGKTMISFDAYTGTRSIVKQIEMLQSYDYVVSAWERTRLEAGDLSAKTMTDFISRYGTWDSFSERYGNNAGTNWQDETFRTALIQNYNLAINGGNKTTKYNIGLSRSDEEGIFKGSSFERTLLNAKMEHQASENLTIGFSTRYNNNTTYGGGVSTQNVLMYRPTEGLGGQLDANEFDEEYLESNDLVNPVLLTEQMSRKKKIENYNLMGEVSYKLNGFTFKTQAGIDSYSLDSRSFDGPYTKNAIKNSGPFAAWSTSKTSKWINTNTINWTKQNFGGGHNLNVMIGQEWSSSHTNTFSLTVKQFPEYITAEKAFGSLSFGLTNDKPATYESSYQLFSFFGRISYDYKGKYLVNASVRADGSSNFAKANRWGYFPSLGTAWRVTEEDFMKDVTVISNLKARYSFGMSGNDRISAFMWTTPWLTDATTQYGVNNVLNPALKPSTLANPNVKWETTISNNLGIDLGLMKNRLNFTLDLYNNRTIDLLLDSSLPANAGFSTQTQNVGSTQNQGIELVVDGTIISTDHFKWTAGFNIAFNKNTILALSEGVDTRYQSTTISTAGPKNEYLVKVGEPIGQMYGYQQDGMYSTDDFIDGTYNTATKYWTRRDGVAYETAFVPRPGDVKFKDQGGATDAQGNPTITEEDKVVIGNANPKHFGGFNTQVQYRGIDFSAFFNWSYGNSVYNATKLNLYNSKAATETNLPVEMKNRFSYIGDDGEPIGDLNILKERNQNSTMYAPYRGTFVLHSGLVEDGSFLRLNNMTLGYTLPQTLTKKAYISNLRIYITGYNLFCLTKYSGFDPEVDALRTTPLTPGVDYWEYPKNRSFIAGINITF